MSMLSDKYKMSKICGRCKRDLVLSCFGVNNSLKDGLMPNCKQCEKAKRTCAPGTKVCSRCLEACPQSDFTRNGKSNRLSRYCIYCQPRVEAERRERKIEKDREHYRANQPAIREQQVWARLYERYGVTQERYTEMLEAQNGVCGICASACKTGQRLVVDHDHETGQVRGLLCKSCNFHLGVLERKEWRVQAEMYLATFA